MTCQECELALAGEEISPAVDERVGAHMAECSACREFAVELRANSEALRAFAMDSMPGLKVSPGLGARPWELPGVRHTGQPGGQHVPWWAAVAAVLVLGFVSSWVVLNRRSPHVPIPASVILPGLPAAQIASVSSGSPQPSAGRNRPRTRFRPAPASLPHLALSRSQQEDAPHILQVKMLTDDPDVVIYWQIEN
jgi:hypothetical protein